MSEQTDPALAARQAAHEKHFIQRVRQRFGIKLTRERYRLWVKKVEEVQSGTRFLWGCAEPGRTTWRIRAGGVYLRVIYDEESQRLVTALPLSNDAHATLGRRKVLRLRAKSQFDPNRLHKRRRLVRSGKWK